MKKVQLLILSLIMLCMIGCSEKTWNQEYSRCSETSLLSMAETEDGFYFVNDYILYYSDKSNMNLWVPVCNKPNCTHTQEGMIDADTGGTIPCNAYISDGAFIEKDGKLYSTTVSYDKGIEIYVCEILQDGSGSKNVYKVPLESNKIQTCRRMVLHGHFVIYYGYLSENGMYQYRLVRLEEDGSVSTLCSVEHEFESNYAHFPMKISRGENLVVSFFLSQVFELENPYDSSIYWRVDGETPKQLILPEEVNSLFSYLSGDTIIHFRQKEGFYKLNLETSEEILLQACFGEDGQGFALNEQWFVETNLYLEDRIETPYLRYFDGEKWTNVEVPKEIANLDSAWIVESLASDRIFMKARGKNSSESATHLYYFMLGEESPKLLPAFQKGEIGMKEESSKQEETSEEEREDEEIITPLGIGEKEEIVVFDNENLLLKITDIYLVEKYTALSKRTDYYFRCNLYWENNTDEDVQINFPSYSINGLQLGRGVGIDMKANSTSLDVEIEDEDKMVNLFTTDTSDKHMILEYYDITEIADIQLQVVLSSITMPKQEMVMVHIYPYGEDKIVKFSREEKESDKVVLDNESVKITVVDYETSGYSKIENDMVYFFVENKTDKEFTMYVREGYVNGVSISDVMAGTNTMIESYNRTIIHGNSSAFVLFYVTDSRYGGDIDSIGDVIEELKLKLNFYRYYLKSDSLENNYLFEEEIVINP